MIMGCYGIGIERTVAAAIEQNHDQDGIIFPMAIAPFQTIVLCLQQERTDVRDASERVYRDLLDSGIEVLLDDRDERPGIKFKDADLIGIPLRVNVGAKSLSQGKVELRHRDTGQTELIEIGRISQRVKEIVRDKTERYPGSCS
jgi:prolyl-tRNA synthetase